ncbi:hypothetical protein [Novosphingobium beihaiensis]|uniref:Uncharacterized protein n=1 Tax=Novosphingobium beihaiensis TaxID=2930389 RepID=A0ABT0BW36_9SPHN|nr:hypothetical protein [Novosphingobium beihaiensis]MCJ2189244.1 hypothetical protein [Novosphingobium beihaiensis]
MASMMLSALGVLCGCGQKKQDAYGWVSPESPPPRPPHCPEPPELVDIRLANGKYADVRIIQFGGARLYVPTNWLVRILVDHTVAKYHLDEVESPSRKTILAPLLGRFKPDIYQEECPGVVHVANLGGVRGQFAARTMNTTQLRSMPLTTCKALCVIHVLTMLK